MFLFYKEIAWEYKIYYFIELLTVSPLHSIFILILNEGQKGLHVGQYIILKRVIFCPQFLNYIDMYIKDIMPAENTLDIEINYTRQLDSRKMYPTEHK